MRSVTWMYPSVSDWGIAGCAPAAVNPGVLSDQTNAFLMFLDGMRGLSD